MTNFDEFVDELLTQDRVCDIILPRLTQRGVLEEVEGFPPRKSLLEDDPRKEEEEEEEEEEDGDVVMRARSRSSSVGSRYVSRSPSPNSEDGEIGDTRGRYVSRSPSLSPDRVIAMQGDKIEGDM